ncbi:Hypothetical predicted protein [Podarcis lilfordi]|uniref:Uncharacterized protein n=1 Tax=Podarcis lilfordi TaxID=74358 RepID=A0AA35K8L6_9SAUR|nr:Hypothetical predicted protein [Podarcis lilfordi]
MDLDSAGRGLSSGTPLLLLRPLATLWSRRGRPDEEGALPGRNRLSSLPHQLFLRLLEGQGTLPPPQILLLALEKGPRLHHLLQATRAGTFDTLHGGAGGKQPQKRGWLFGERGKRGSPSGHKAAPAPHYTFPAPLAGINREGGIILWPPAAVLLQYFSDGGEVGVLRLGSSDLSLVVLQIVAVGGGSCVQEASVWMCCYWGGG